MKLANFATPKHEKPFYTIFFSETAKFNSAFPYHRIMDKLLQLRTKFQDTIFKL